MNLREAIEAGSTRVDGRCRNEFIRAADEPGKFEVCAMGAAFLGCHPGVAPPIGADEEDQLAWMDDITSEVSDWVARFEHDEQLDEVFIINDKYLRPEDGWDALVARLEVAQLADWEVCGDVE
jgi:hypothetical protein